jgi:hypothetical protein
MAGAPASPPAPTPSPVEDPVFKEMQRRVKRAETDRNRHQPRIADCNKYTRPWVHGFNQNQPGNDFDEIFDSTAMTVLEDFAAENLNTFTPRKNNWLEESPVASLDAAQKKIIEGDLAKRQGLVFFEMARSNLYQALQEAYLDLGPGTMCVLVMDIDPAQPLHCEAIPLTDLLITRGPYGFVDGTFRRKKYLRNDVNVLWPDADLSKLGPEPQQGDQDLEITDGCWRDWSDKGNEAYQYAVECQGKIIYQKRWNGPGSCPFIVARWSRDATTAWGIGPTYRELPNIKTLNHVRYLSLKNYDKHVDPPMSYEDDGVANFDNGIEPGRFFPRAPNSDEPKALESKSAFDVQVFEVDELRSAIRRAHYQDRPEQIGKTPPTATQWADEAAERARRMGTPATNLVQELQYPLYRRFVYLLDQRGVLPKVTLDGSVVALQPVSPLLRAQEQEEVVRNDKFAELIIGRFGPQVGMVVIDIFKYAEAQGMKLGINPKLIRKEADIEAAIKQLLPVLQATGTVPAAGAPTAPLEGLLAP